MSETQLNGVMNTTMAKIKEMIDVDTIIGKPIETAGGVTIIPVSKVSCGYASGGSDFQSKKVDKTNFGGGAGAGVTLNPIGFLVISGEKVKLLQMQPADTTVDHIVNTVPDVIDQISSLVGKKKEKKEEK